MNTEFVDDAINDLGTDSPDYKTVSAKHYARDAKVRAAVMQRAGGKCEYCGGEGFERDGGIRYLESHHIIALANDGADRMSNVIAVCANDHREAHFGKRRVEIEQEMIEKVKVAEDHRLAANS